MTPSIDPQRMAAIAASVPAPAIVHGIRTADAACSQCGETFSGAIQPYSRCYEHWPTAECDSTLGTLDVTLRYRLHGDDEDGIDLEVTKVSFGGPWIDASPDEFSQLAIDKWFEDARAHYLRPRGV